MHALPTLPYDYNALEPFIDEQTMRIHHTKHHQAYIDKLNGAIKGTEFENLTTNELLRRINELPESMKAVVRNHGGGHSNHSFFWQIMAPKSNEIPTGELLEAINKSFVSFDKFKEEFQNAGINRFGSGWAWLITDKGGLSIINTQNQDSPIMEGKTPILGVDVWEHAYYLKYQNKRADYLAAWWNVVNWKKVNELFQKSK